MFKFKIWSELISKFWLLGDRCTPGGNIDGDFLPASSHASLPTLLLTSFLLRFLSCPSFQYVKSWCCDQCWQWAGLNCPSPNPAPCSERAQRSGGQLYSARPRGTLALGKKTWPELRDGRSSKVGEDVKIPASITSCCSQPRLLSSAFMSSLNERRWLHSSCSGDWSGFWTKHFNHLGRCCFFGRHCFLGQILLFLGQIFLFWGR